MYVDVGNIDSTPNAVFSLSSIQSLCPPLSLVIIILFLQKIDTEMSLNVQ